MKNKFFSVSYNEELSGLYGGVLQSQTKFAAASVAAILNLYKSNKYTKSVPNSVILIGHSMVSFLLHAYFNFNYQKKNNLDHYSTQIINT